MKLYTHSSDINSFLVVAPIENYISVIVGVRRIK